MQARACPGETKPLAWLAEKFESRNQEASDLMQAWINHGAYRKKWQNVVEALDKGSR